MSRVNINEYVDRWERGKAVSLWCSKKFSVIREANKGVGFFKSSTKLALQAE